MFTISSEEDASFPYTIFVETDATERIIIECPCCALKNRIRIAMVNEEIESKCSRCHFIASNRDRLLAYHSYVLAEVNRIAFQSIRNRISKMMGESFRGIKGITIGRG